MGETVNKLTLAPLPRFIFRLQVREHTLELGCLHLMIASLLQHERGRIAWLIHGWTFRTEAIHCAGWEVLLQTGNPFGHGTHKSISVLVFCFAANIYAPEGHLVFPETHMAGSMHPMKIAKRDSSKKGRGRDVQQDLNAVLYLWHYLQQSLLKSFCMWIADMDLAFKACVRTWISRLWSAKEP